MTDSRPRSSTTGSAVPASTGRRSSRRSPRPATVSGEQIARRAFEISKSSEGGDAHANWLRAESELGAA